MKNFATKKIILENEEIGSIFSSARQAKKITIEKAAAKTGISVKNLQILEKGNLSSLPEGVYGKNFIKEYALFLGVDYQSIIESLNEQKKSVFSSNDKNIFSRQAVKKINFIFFPKIFKIFLIILIVSASLIYLGFSLKKSFSPPSLWLSSPSENTTINSTSIMVVGSTEPEAQVLINNEPVGINEFGDFSKEINLKIGINNIKIIAKKKYSQENVIERYILVEP